MISLYCYQNKINGKVYIGQTVDLKDRDRKHTFSDAMYMPIDRAILKYGRDEFSLWIIDQVATQQEADDYEIDMIAKMRKELGREYVYNVSDGGGAPMKGKKHSAASIKKMSEAHKGNKGAPGNKTWVGRKHSEESIRKMSATKKGKPSPNKGKTKYASEEERIAANRLSSRLSQRRRRLRLKHEKLSLASRFLRLPAFGNGF
jgi:group I intron endonuclease